MKIGALALLRNKRHVSVQTSRDSWRFGLKQHTVLQEEVLTVFVSGKDGNDVTCGQHWTTRLQVYTPLALLLTRLNFH